MIVLRKKIIILKTTEDFVKEFPGAAEYIDKNSSYFQELALEYETESLFLQQIVSTYLKEMNLHFFVFATMDQLFVFELNMENILVINNEVKIMAGKKHLEQYYTNLVFDRYKYHPAVKAIQSKNYSYDMAVDVFNKIGDIEIKIIEQ